MAGHSEDPVNWDMSLTIAGCEKINFDPLLMEIASERYRQLFISK